MILLKESNKTFLESEPVIMDESLALIDNKDKFSFLHFGIELLFIRDIFVFSEFIHYGF
jgi:hypothetical protein